MTLWLIFALMTAAAIFAAIWPLVRHAGAARSGSDVAVYRDQLDEVERDLTAGLIGKTEAQAARVEISRRLLVAADAAQAAPAASDPVSAAGRRRAAAVASLLVLPIVAGGLYFRLGSPELASAPLSPERNVASAQQSVESLVAQAEERLKRNPEDGRGWEILAPVYMRLGRYSDSATAWRNALQLLGESAERQADLGEALTAEADGVVTADAKAAFVRAATLDATLVSARFYLGLAAEQDGQREKAAQIWRDLIAQAPAGAPWVGDVRNALARVEAPPAPASRWQASDVRNALGRVESASTPVPPPPPPTTTTPPGPSAAQMEAAADQPPQQQDATIRGMVDRLAARLKQDGSDVDGWVRLVRSYNVLGEPEKARAAAADARQALAGDPGKLQRLDAALKELEAGNAAAPAPAPAPGPGAAQTAPGSAPPGHEQGATIENMVERLAERLKKSGSDPAGWLMLARSYMTLGEKDKATAAVSDARQALANDPGKLEQFNQALKQFGIGE
ncbi:MAG: c-type cytochrome biogenesis protein CcmI [Xanthobacteraceae bacterium]